MRVSEGERERERSRRARVERRNAGWRREAKRREEERREERRQRVAGAATSRAPQCLSVLHMDITFDETDSTRRYWHPYISV